MEICFQNIYAGDMILFSTNAKRLEQLVLSVRKCSTDHNLMLNNEKAKIMSAHTQNYIQLKILINNSEIENVTFYYLGSITYNNHYNHMLC